QIDSQETVSCADPNIRSFVAQHGENLGVLGSVWKRDGSERRAIPAEDPVVCSDKQFAVADRQYAVDLSVRQPSPCGGRPAAAECEKSRVQRAHPDLAVGRGCNGDDWRRPGQERGWRQRLDAVLAKTQNAAAHIRQYHCSTLLFPQRSNLGGI